MVEIHLLKPITNNFVRSRTWNCWALNPSKRLKTHRERTVPFSSLRCNKLNFNNRKLIKEPRLIPISRSELVDTMHSFLLFLTLAFLTSNGNAQYVDGSFSYDDSYRQYPSYDYLRPFILANDYYPTQNRLFVGLTNFLQTTTTTTTSTSVVTCTVSTTACARRRRSLTKLEDIDEVIDPTFVNKSVNIKVFYIRVNITRITCQNIWLCAAGLRPQQRSTLSIRLAVENELLILRWRIIVTRRIIQHRTSFSRAVSALVTFPLILTVVSHLLPTFQPEIVSFSDLSRARQHLRRLALGLPDPVVRQPVTIMNAKMTDSRHLPKWNFLPFPHLFQIIG